MPRYRTALYRTCCAPLFVLLVACIFVHLTGGRAQAASAFGARPAWAIAWKACPPGSVAALAGFNCSSIDVPLDYRYPNGPSIKLAVVNHPAADRAHRIGTLFVNPGGPGGTGTVDIPGWIGYFPPALVQRFDIASWDPRGIGSSTAVQCFPNANAEARFLGDNADFPPTEADQASYIETWLGFGRHCFAFSGSLLEHTSTADTARDLETLRRRIGEGKINYLGLSYGTYLGATYVNLFPDNLRAVVLDGNVAPSAWTATGPGGNSQSLSARIGTDVLTARVFNDFLNLCGQTDVAHCAFSSGSPAATRARWEALAARLRQGPIFLSGTKKIAYATLIDQIQSAALIVVQPHVNPLSPEQGSTGWPGIAAAFESLWQARNNPPVPLPTPPPSSKTTPPYGGAESFYTVACGDAPVPPTAAFPRLSAKAEQRAGPFGLAAVWLDEPCSSWPIHTQNGYAGPFNHWTSTPILVIGNYGDPSTPYADAVAMSRELARARLLSVDGYGHTVFLNPSSCANAAMTAYYISGTLPAPGTVCREDRRPFQ